MALHPLVPRPVHDSVDALLAGARREGAFVPVDSRSGSRFERVTLDGTRCIVKYLHPDDDFVLRAMGDIAAVPLRAWAAGLFDTSPDHIDHATLGVAPWGRNGWGCALLLRDVSAHLVPVGDEPLTDEAHLGFLHDLAGFAAANWNRADTVGLLPWPVRWQFFGDHALAAEAALGFPEPVPRLAIEGWQRFASRAPRPVVEVIAALRHDPAPLVAAVQRTPSTLLHGDWKLGNLGRAKGRTVLIDWAYLGMGPVAHELAWYLAINRARLPRGHTKESTIAALGAALERHGIALDGWWDDQVALCLLGGLVQFGWEKAFGPDDELAWWCARALEGAERL